jgi:Flp pilus assembly pilin Flp
MNKVFKDALLRFCKDESAQAMVEYVILLAFLVAASYGGIKLFAAAWQKKFKATRTMRAEVFGVGP